VEARQRAGDLRGRPLRVRVHDELHAVVTKAVAEEQSVSPGLQKLEIVQQLERGDCRSKSLSLLLRGREAAVASVTRLGEAGPRRRPSPAATGESLSRDLAADQPPTDDGGRQWLEARRRRIEAALDAALPADSDWPPTIHRAVRYSLFAGGKRTRPLLVLAAGEAVGGADEALMPLACAVEMIHTYSLIHDDLPAMDNDDLRRGKPTSHKVFGEAIAILAGDALLTRAFHVLVEAGPRGGSDDHVSRRLRGRLMGAAAAPPAIGGQVADLEAEGRDDVTLADLERLHRAKTGALLGACVVARRRRRCERSRLEATRSEPRPRLPGRDVVLDATKAGSSHRRARTRSSEKRCSTSCAPPVACRRKSESSRGAGIDRAPGGAGRAPARPGRPHRRSPRVRPR
jgi:hypothetical protein